MIDVRVQGDQAQITLELRDLEDIVDDLECQEVSVLGLFPRSEDFLKALDEAGIKRFKDTLGGGE